MSKFRKGDQVKILAGKDKGKTGKIIRIVTKTGSAVVEGLNLVTRHRKPKKSREKGQKLILPAPINASNLSLVCPNCGKTTRISYSILEGGGKTRICKHCKKSV